MSDIRIVDGAGNVLREYEAESYDQVEEAIDEAYGHMLEFAERGYAGNPVGADYFVEEYVEGDYWEKVRGYHAEALRGLIRDGVKKGRIPHADVCMLRDEIEDLLREEFGYVKVALP